ncbi:MAG: fumarylacetoacetate hydrolase family protein [Bacteroidales bacterium]|nr:fumarylacetoacetate hydrolase family protein [Bacteroidales bacterium]
MKIICIGRNYINHARELGNPVPEEPVFFMKPDSALIRNNKPFFYPDFSNEIHHEVEIVIRISRLGKHIETKFADRYYEEIGIGIDFTARDLQKKQATEGKPWEIAKAFDGSAPLGKFVKRSSLPDYHAISFRLEKNGKEVQKGNTKDMIFGFDELIAYISGFLTLKIGDLIFTGTPAGVGPVKIGDQLTAYLEERRLLDFYVR